MRAVNPLPPTEWLARIESAHSVAELMVALRDYLATLTPEEGAQLPAGISAEVVRAPTDIQEWAVTLARHDLRAGAEVPPALHRTAMVFAAAGVKMPKLAE